MEEIMLKFKEFLLEGTFVGMRFDIKSQAIIHKYQIENNIPNPITGDDLHVTVVYSKKKMQNVVTYGILDFPISTSIRKFEVFGDKALVGLLDSAILEARHIDLLTKYSGTHQYDTYQPHVSLSYDFTGDVSDLTPFIGDLSLVSEYEELLENLM